MGIERVYGNSVIFTYRKETLNEIVSNLRKKYGIILLKEVIEEKPYRADYVGCGLQIKIRQNGLTNECKVYIEGGIK